MKEETNEERKIGIKQRKFTEKKALRKGQTKTTRKNQERKKGIK